MLIKHARQGVLFAGDVLPGAAAHSVLICPSAMPQSPLTDALTQRGEGEPRVEAKRISLRQARVDLLPSAGPLAADRCALT